MSGWPLFWSGACLFVLSLLVSMAVGYALQGPAGTVLCILTGFFGGFPSGVMMAAGFDSRPL